MKRGGGLSYVGKLGLPSFVIKVEEEMKVIIPLKIYG